MKRSDAPMDLQGAGRALWMRLRKEFEIPREAEPLLAELCRIADSLAETRRILKADGMLVEGRKHALADLEPKLSGQFRNLWKLLGLADPQEPRIGPGRPLRS